MGVLGTSCAYRPRPRVRGSHSLLNIICLLNLRQMSGKFLVAHHSLYFMLVFATATLEGFKREMLAQAFASYDRQRSVFWEKTGPAKSFVVIWIDTLSKQPNRDRGVSYGIDDRLACHGWASSPPLLSHPTWGFYRDGQSWWFPVNIARYPPIDRHYDDQTLWFPAHLGNMM